MSTPQLQRMVSRTGRIDIERIGVQKRVLSDLYHLLLDCSWPRLLVAFFASYAVANTLFALMYMLDPGGVDNVRIGSFADHFFFSIQTMATIGYGQMVPRSTYAHLLVALEALVGLLGMAMATGLVFAKFSRPTARVMFSNVAVVTRRDGVPSFMFRMANQRGNQIVDAKVRLVLARTERTREGEEIRRFHDLRLIRDHIVAFALTFTAVHPIDEKSPLHGETAESLQTSSSEIIVSLVGIDETMSQTVHVRWSYIASDICFGARLKDVILRAPDGHRYVDYNYFHDVVPETTAQES